MREQGCSREDNPSWKQSVEEARASKLKGQTATIPNRCLDKVRVLSSAGHK